MGKGFNGIKGYKNLKLIGQMKLVSFKKESILNLILGKVRGNKKDHILMS